MTKRVLLVEDDDDIRTVAELCLSSLGSFSVVSACGGREAIAIAAGGGIDVILLDVVMPGFDGVETLAALRVSPATASIPVIFVTAQTQKREVSALLERGALGVIRKPFDPLTLAQEVESLLAGGGSTSVGRQVIAPPVHGEKTPR